MAHDVFISYVLEDGQIAQAVCRYLEENNIRCWIAPRDISPGRIWAESIEKAVTESKLLVLIFSTGSNGSVAVKNEINLASDGNIPILTFRMENIQPTGGLKYYLGTSHWLDATTQPLENHLSHLLNSIKILAPEASSGVSEAIERETKVEPEINSESKAKIKPEVNVEPQTNVEPEINVEPKAKVEPEINAQSKPKDEPKAIFIEPTSVVVSEQDASERPTSILTRFKEWCKSLFGFNILLLKIDGALSRDDEVVRYSGTIAAAGVIIVFCAMVLTVQVELLGLASTGFIAGLVALCLAAWVLACLARTHLVYGSICGGLALIIIMGLLAFHEFFLVEKNFRMIGLIVLCVVIGLIAFFTFIGSALRIPVLWIPGGLISVWCFFYSINRLYWDIFFKYYDSSENICYRLIALSSLFGAGLMIYGVFSNRHYVFVWSKPRRRR